MSVFAYVIPEPDPAAPVVELPEHLWEEALTLFHTGLTGPVQLFLAVLAGTLMLLLIRKIV